jgi:hypothetical protein
MSTRAAIAGLLSVIGVLAVPGLMYAGVLPTSWSFVIASLAGFLAGGVVGFMMRDGERRETDQWLRVIRQIQAADGKSAPPPAAAA